MACRTCVDPVAYLSNGDTVTLRANVLAGSGQVALFAWTLDVPAGLTVKNIAYSGPVPQTLSWSAGEPDNMFQSTGEAVTSDPGAEVLARMIVSNASGSEQARVRSWGEGGMLIDLSAGL